jgi:hypothetical protein
VRVDWSKLAEFLRSRRRLEPAWADDAAEDDDETRTRAAEAALGRGDRLLRHHANVLAVILIDAESPTAQISTGGE